MGNCSGKCKPSKKTKRWAWAREDDKKNGGRRKDHVVRHQLSTQSPKMQQIEEKLGFQLNKQSAIDSRLMSASSTFLNQKIEFMSSSKPQSSINGCLKDKYINLGGAVKKYGSETSTTEDGEGLPQPRVVLFSEDQLEYTWKYLDGGAGLNNCGNTCFLNAVTQCLVHTPPLANYLLSGHHFSQCRAISREKCILCNMHMLMKRSLTGAADSFAPKWFINNLQFIGRHFRNGRQEDAHEYLRLCLEKMQKCALSGNVNANLDRYSKETTVINQIFGGFLRSQVICLRCKARSNTYDPLLDVSLDVKNHDSLEKAFSQFVAPDKLDMENAYKCDKCKQKVTALKRFTIHKPPNVLTIQLKRFQYGNSLFGGAGFGGGGKISKFIKYPATLDVRTYMSNKQGPPEMYHLFASIQHEGYSCQSGHYVANVRCGSRWYHFNDSMKRRMSMQQCLNENSAYVLFYIRESNVPQATLIQNPSPKVPTDPKKHVNGHSSTPNHTFIGPVRPQVIQAENKAPFRPVNGGIKSPASATSTPSQATPLSANRDKVRIAFGVKPAPKMPSQQKSSTVNQINPPSSSKPSNRDLPAPRLVMKIKDGKSITIETSPDGQRRIVSDDDEVIARMNEKRQKKLTKKARLVPYGDESSSDSDWSSKASGDIASKKNGHASQIKSNGQERDGVIFDEKLLTTTSVPGNAHLYDTVTMKDKLAHNSHGGSSKLKDMKSPIIRPGHSTPVKRQFSETLSCDISPPPTPKHAGGPEWHSQLMDNILSPSVGSNHSSTHSNTSTSDWSVSKKQKSSSMHSSDRPINGWTITPGMAEDSVHKSKSDSCVAESGASGGKKEGFSKSFTNLRRQVMQEELKATEMVNSNFSSPYQVNNDKESLLNDTDQRNQHHDEDAMFKKQKKHKKHKKHRHDDAEQKYSILENESSEFSHKKKKKKKKHKHKEREREERDESRYSRDGYNRNSKHEHDYAEKDGESRNSKHEHDYTEKDEDRHRQRRASSSSVEYEWVEKKVEPPPLRKYQSAPGTPRQNWDHYVRDGYVRSSSGTNTPVKSVGDELKASHVAQQLENLTSYGYGAPVASWDGNRSNLDNGRHQKRKSEEDLYEEELDRGKVKKVKHRECEGDSQRPHSNVFQEEQEKRNKSKINWSNISVGDNSFFNKPSSKAFPVALTRNIHHRF